MPENDIGEAIQSNMNDIREDFSVAPSDTDGAEDQKETTYQNEDWTQDYGYYKLIPEFKTAVDTKATWTVGAGFTTDEVTELVLGTIKGNGKDSFNSILKNMIKVKTISKDSFAEVMRDKDGILVNLKPLNPGNMKIIQNLMGRIIRYEQTTTKKTYKPEQIFHLSHERIADEVHGTRITDSLKWLIEARNESLVDWKDVLHQNIKPRWKISLDTDDKDKIAAFKTKYDQANAGGENMYIPKGTVEVEVLGVSPNATLNPLNWINQLNDYFFQAVNVPQIIVGNAKEFTDASGKIVYLSYEQSVKGEQLYIEEQVLGQLNLEIHLTFPASLQNELISDEGKQPTLEANKPNDTTAELAGPT